MVQAPRPNAGCAEKTREYQLIVVIFLVDIPSSYTEILGETNFHTWKFPRRGSKAKDREKRKKDAPGTAGVPGGHDRTLAVKSRKTAEKSERKRKTE